MAEHVNPSGVNFNVEFHENRTLLHKSASTGCTNTVNNLLKTRADINAEDENRKTPLHHSAMNGCKDVVEIFIKAGANVNAEDDNKKTPLHCSAMNGHKDVVEILINAKANVNAEDDNQKTPLHYSVESSHKDVVKILCKAGANINAADNTKSTPLHYAASNGSAEIVVTLLTVDATDNAADDIESTSLHDAVFLGNNDMTTSLLKTDGNFSAEDDERRTPLHAAAHKDIQQDFSSAECMTLPLDRVSSDDMEATTSALPLGISLQECDDLKQKLVDYLAKCPLLEQNNHEVQYSTGVTAVLNNKKIVINMCPVTMQFHNEVVQNNPQQPTQFTHTENVTVNNTTYYSGTKPADSDVDTQASDSKDNNLEDDNEEMDRKNRDLIKKNFIPLSKSLSTVVDQVCVQLWSKQIISDVTKETILVKCGPRKQADALLNLISSRGPHAFEALYKSALAERLFDVADILHPDLKPHGPTVDTN
ncbi:hypothetical protein BsWGS_26137 [Bradybaena similaris]